MTFWGFISQYGGASIAVCTNNSGYSEFFKEFDSEISTVFFQNLMIDQHASMNIEFNSFFALYLIEIFEVNKITGCIINDNKSGKVFCKIVEKIYGHVEFFTTNFNNPSKETSSFYEKCNSMHSF